jgi:hypothetical protein
MGICIIWYLISSRCAMGICIIWYLIFNQLQMRDALFMGTQGRRQRSCFGEENGKADKTQRIRMALAMGGCGAQCVGLRAAVQGLQTGLQCRAIIG